MQESTEAVERKFVAISPKTHERLTRRALALAYQRQRRTSMEYVIAEALAALELIGEGEPAPPTSEEAQ